MTTEPINVAASIIADISAGIYRSPAGALKELISNAFDADARNVRISTGWPSFNTFTCTDDGDGMTPDQFKEIMLQIGGSSKRDEGEETKTFRRPYIGRIGIGILSIAQVCRRFTVLSTARNNDVVFKATIDLDPFMLAEARRAKLGEKLSVKKGIVKIGTYKMEEAKEPRNTKYTKIVMSEIDPGFKQRLQNLPMKRGGITPKSFDKGKMIGFLKNAERGTVAERGAYAQLIWELAATAPVKYMESGPIQDDSVIDDIVSSHKEYNFRAFIDGVELLKPVLLPPRPRKNIQFKVYPIVHDSKLSNGRQLRVRGYLYWQNKTILPRELQGILIRVRNVAIGQYDPTYIGYPHHEGWKFSQMSGELFVESGLDAAVNIDRASFRESDEGFIELQSYLFERLGGGTDEGAGIFTSIKKETSIIREKKKKKILKKRAVATAEIIEGTRKPITFTQARKPVSGTGIKYETGSIQADKKLLRNVPKKYQQIFLAICGLLEKETANRISESKRKTLYTKIAELLAEHK